MPVLENLKEELRQTRTLKIISNALAEISAVRIKSIRGDFEKNSLFFEEITQLYHSVKLSSKIKKLQTGAKKQVFVKGKNAHVAITSNQHFYGTLNIDIMSTFYDKTKTSKADLIVIGSTGKEYLEAKGGVSFYSVIFENDSPTDEEIRDFIDRLSRYEKVFVYYPKFISVLSQKVDIVDITYSPSEMVMPEKEIGYIFEPELPYIADFFEKQVKYLLFARVILETKLSKTAARLISMNKAEERADELIKETHLQYAKAYKSLINARLIETFAGIKKWRK